MVFLQKSLKLLTSIGLILIILILTSCAPAHYKMYPGPKLPDEQKATLMTQRYYESGETFTTHIFYVDGKPLKGSFWEKEITVSVLPGTHTIEVLTYSRAELPVVVGPYMTKKIITSRSGLIPVEFNTEAGHKYLVDGWNIVDKKLSRKLLIVSDLEFDSKVGSYRANPIKIIKITPPKE